LSIKISFATSLMASAMLAVAACGGDDDGELPPGPSSPARTFALLPIEAISAAGDYIGATGFDGQTFDLTDPAGCEAIQEEERAATTDEERQQIADKTRGRLCINRTISLLKDDEAAVVVQEYLTGVGWVLRMEETDGVWAVTLVQQLGGPID
jgi:hypothetical protein